MSPDRPQDSVYAAFVERFFNQGLLDTFREGLLAGNTIPGTNFPYLTMDSGGEPVATSSSTTEYARPTVRLSVHAKTWSEARRLAKMVKDVFRWADMSLTGAEGPHATLSAKPGNVILLEEDAFWKAIVDFEVTTAESVNRNPAPGERA